MISVIVVTVNTRWCIYSAGDESWPFGCSLRFVSGEQFGPHGSVSVPMLKPGEVTDVSVEMTSPSQTGIHQGQWRMCTAAGLYFGGKFLHISCGAILLLIVTVSLSGGTGIMGW